jgi:3-methyl-2-oxobutanoate hydroxymethyltransferase
MHSLKTRTKVSTELIRSMKGKRKIVSLTAADFITAKVLDDAEVDIILVGDSLGTTLLGYKNTVHVTMRDMLHHLKAVTRAKPLALVVADMPFGSYQRNTELALRNATRLIQEGGADAVKLEGGMLYEETVTRIIQAGIPVMGHIGLLPQSVLSEGYRVKGRTPEELDRLQKDLQSLERAGCFACVLEYIRAPVAKELTQGSRIPTIGIGSGKSCDGQVLVTTDLLGLQSWLNPRAARAYAKLGEQMKKAFTSFARDVRTGRFPGPKESFK